MNATEGFPADPSWVSVTLDDGGQGNSRTINIGKNGKDVKGNKNKSVLTGFS